MGLVLTVVLLLAQAPAKPEIRECHTAGNTTICHGENMSVTCVRTQNIVKCETILKGG